MAKSLSPAKQLESAARIAIVLLPLGSEERIALARALNALVPKPTGKPLTVKQIIRMTTRELHAKAPGICYCQKCSSAKYAAAAKRHALLIESGVVTTWSYRDAFAPDNRPAAFDREAMATCACGHSSDSHAADELDNLLACSECDCDHFHYQEQAAA